VTRIEYLVADGTQPICYKTKDGYIPLEERAAPVAQAPAVTSDANVEVNTKTLYVLNFTISGEAEEMTFNSKKKLDKMMAFYAEKEIVTDMKVTEYQVMA
jgi:hypothetical protein